MLIQSDASKKGKGSSMQGSSNWELVVQGGATVSSDLSKNQVSVGSSPDRSVCITSMLSARKLTFWRPDLHSKGVDAMQQNWPVQLGHTL